jgi:ABC-type transporter Mla maintaining outer membrane lipid asymmetry permease subunit MlaE
MIELTLLVLTIISIIIAIITGMLYILEYLGINTKFKGIYKKNKLYIKAT